MKFIFLVVCLWQIQKSKSFKLHGDFKRDVVSGVFDHSNSERFKRSTETLPSTLKLTLDFYGLQLNFNFVKNNRIPSCIPTYPKTSDNCIDDVIKKKITTHYQDHRFSASLQIRNGASGPSEMHGSFIYSDQQYYFEPTSENFTLSNKQKLYVSIIPQHFDFHSDFKIPDPVTLRYKPLRRDLPRRHKRATGTYNVELFLAIDFDIYTFWYNRHTDISSQTARRTAALDDVKRYYAFMINGLDSRYKNMPGATFTINVIFAGIYIAETTTTWTAGSGNQIAVATVLSNFETWVISELGKGTIPKHDHAMMFTRHDLVGVTSSTTGYAYVGAMCSQKSVSICEDDFNLISQTTAAHEMGHSLGAIHDGTDTNTCLDAGFIMSASSSARINSNNPWKFSSCSTSEINTYINGIGANNNCMLQEISSANRNELDSYTASPLGQTFNIDQQCELTEGSGSFLCRGFYNLTNYDEICTAAYCQLTGSTLCSLMVPADGTSCGNKKWCQSGQCVSSNLAPSKTENCLFGDEPGTSCSTMISSTPWQCYSSSSYQKCCQSCETIRQTEAGCEFGDKLDCSAITLGASCYQSSTISSCCGTCKKFETGVTGCEYGDKSICPSITTGFSCYDTNFETQCCMTCRPFFTGRAECKYGDKVSGCVKPTTCFGTQATDTCCGTCYDPPSTTTSITTRSTTTPTTVTTTQALFTPSPTGTTLTSTLKETTTQPPSTTSSTGTTTTTVSSKHTTPAILSTSTLKPTYLSPTTVNLTTVLTTASTAFSSTARTIFSTVSSTQFPTASKTTGVPTVSTTEINLPVGVPSWAVPAIAGAGGAVLVFFIIVFICCVRKKKPQRRDSTKLQKNVFTNKGFEEHGQRNPSGQIQHPVSSTHQHTYFTIQNGNKEDFHEYRKMPERSSHNNYNQYQQNRGIHNVIGNPKPRDSAVTRSDQIVIKPTVLKTHYPQNSQNKPSVPFQYTNSGVPVHHQHRPRTQLQKDLSQIVAQQASQPKTNHHLSRMPSPQQGLSISTTAGRKF